MEIIDLSHPIYDGQPVYPGAAKTIISTWNTYEETARYWGSSMSQLFTNCSLFLSDHASTHVDATRHFDPTPKGKGADLIPLEYMISDGVVLDVSHKKPDEYVEVDDVMTALRRVGESLKHRDVVLFHTGASTYWNTPAYFDRTVGIRRRTVEWLIDRDVKVLGVDAITIDLPKKEPDYPAHALVREREYYHIENLANLDKIPKPRFRFIGLPLRLVNASGSPIRAVAVVED